MKNETSNLGYNLNIFFVFAFFLILRPFSAHSQIYPVSIEWNSSETTAINGDMVSVPVFKGGSYPDGLPFYSYQQKVKRGNYTLSFSDVVTTEAPAADVAFLERMHAVVKESVAIALSTATARDEMFLQAGLLPYVTQNGKLHRITGFKIHAVYQGQESHGIEKAYASNSVLNNGDWYKISVKKDGVYKIDKSFLVSCGIDVKTLDPATINIYGNASGRLSEFNNGPYTDDLIKNPIQIIGESDGVFNDEDYIVFYGAGPNRWDYLSASGFERNQHIYSEVNCYFIHISASDTPLRISTLPASVNPMTDVVTSYDYIDIHELEINSLVGGGQRWYGELFDGELSQNINFSVPDIDLSTPVRAQYAVASDAHTANNKFLFSVNSNLLHTQLLSQAGGGNFGRDAGVFSFTAPAATFAINLTLNRLSPAVKGYLDLIEITARRSLRVMNASDQFQFRDLASVGVNKSSQFNISGMSSAHAVWEITDRKNPALVTGTLTGNDFSFQLDSPVLREFVVFNTTSNKLLTPLFVERVPNQDLHALSQVDYLIVTHPDFLGQAERLAGLHEQQGTTTHVVTTKQIYNEYASGVVDATAIRRFVKMFYERANGDTALKPKFLLLFGDATYDPKNRIGGNNYFVPTYEVLNSEDHIHSLVTDDYFGLLDNNESIEDTDLMDIGVGRLLISTNDHAVEQVNKIEHYMKNGSSLYTGGPNACCTGQNGVTFGDWRLNYAIIADDEQNGDFIEDDAEPIITDIQANYPEMNSDKLYLDAYVQTSTAGGQRYPQVFDAITDRVQRGGLIVNYIGHGGEVGAAEERVITIPQIQSWSNIDKLSLFVTATCEFTKFDDPSRISAGEWVSLNPTGGAIALMTTTRSVYVPVNSVTVASFYSHVFERDANHRPLPFGEIMRRTQNSSGMEPNRRTFTLIGDPALRIALPMWRVVTDSINHLDPSLLQDTVRALSKMSVSGHLEDYDGNLLTSFNGVLSPTIYDKERTNHTLANDADSSPVINFKTQTNALYKGKASVVNGKFAFDFIVPKDINYAYGPGKISYYAQSSNTDADGSDIRFKVGGINTNAVADTKGPEIELYLNDKAFVNTGITSQEPVLIVECFDENGINTVGNGVGHDLIAILDGNTANPIVLNNYYTGNLDSYQSGKVEYILRTLPVGPHTLEVKIWDVNNNSSIARIAFTVVEDAAFELDHVLNYPNPFTTKTTFFFEHNQSCSSLETQVNIYTVSGRLVKTINKQVTTSGFRAEGIDWDGRDDFGDQLAKGVYVYRLSVELPEGGKAEKMEKLVLLR